MAQMTGFVSERVGNPGQKHFYVPASKDRGHIVLLSTICLLAGLLGPMVELPKLEEQFQCVRLRVFCF